MNKIKFGSILKKVGKKYKPMDKELIITRNDFNQIKELFNSQEVISITIFEGDKI